MSTGKEHGALDVAIRYLRRRVTYTIVFVKWNVSVKSSRMLAGTSGPLVGVGEARQYPRDLFNSTDNHGHVSLPALGNLFMYPLCDILLYELHDMFLPPITNFGKGGHMEKFPYFLLLSSGLVTAFYDFTKVTQIGQKSPHHQCYAQTRH